MWRERRLRARRRSGPPSCGVSSDCVPLVYPDLCLRLLERPRQRGTMKITKLETFIVDGGWRAWMYVKVETDEGLTGWGECSDTRVPHAVSGAVRDLSTVLVGQDPRAYEARFIDMARTMRSSPGGIAARSEEHTSELQSQFHLV